MIALHARPAAAADVEIRIQDGFTVRAGPGAAVTLEVHDEQAAW